MVLCGQADIHSAQLGLFPAPDQEDVQFFADHFKSNKAVHKAAEGNIPKIASDLVNTSRRYRLSHSSSRHASNMILIEEDALQYMQVFIAKFGIRRFRPNLAETAYSPWNSAHRIIAIELSSILERCRPTVFLDRTWITSRILGY